MPEGSQEWFSNFRTAVDSSVFPQVFGGLPGRPVPVDSPDAAILRDPDVIAAKKSIVEIDGLASSCNEQITGTGFVVADDRVVTNAHVVAGVTEPRVSVGGLGFGRRATVVYFDPRTDLAVLAVPGLDARALPLHTQPLKRGDGAVVAGFPEGGPYTTVPARVRDRQQARGRDIYDSRSVTREVYALRTSVRPGNSGGPLLLADGSVAGVVFAAAVDDTDTGYALTESEVDAGIQAGLRATNQVSTGRCA
jgi:S1-C subfamily serine protease